MWDIAFSIPIPNLTGLFCGWWLGAASMVIMACVKLRLDRRSAAAQHHEEVCDAD